MLSQHLHCGRIAAIKANLSVGLQRFVLLPFVMNFKYSNQIREGFDGLVFIR
jgi:hypothetical protein